MTKNDEKAEVLNALATSAPNSKTSCPLSTQPPKLEDWNWEQNKTPIIQEETVSKLLHHTDMCPEGQTGSNQKS